MPHGFAGNPPHRGAAIYRYPVGILSQRDRPLSIFLRRENEGHHGSSAGDELRRGGRGRRLRRGRRTRPPVTRSRRRTRSPVTSSDVDRGRGRMRLPDQLEYKEYIILLRPRPDAATVGMDDDGAQQS
uniref:Uncharacterized protein n=1 Tax=Oryza nivara TaxID=4536 RepID=A0A0E0H1T6_ORYNI